MAGSRTSALVAVLAVLVAGAAGAVPADRVIPLSDITAFGMPGTRPVDLSAQGARELLEEIRKALDDRPATDGAFVVRGEGTDALRAAHAVLVQGQPPATSFGAAEPKSLVFFSHASNVYVHVTGVELRGATITVTYRLVPHKTKEMTAHLALIPLSGLPKGTIRVEINPESGGEAVAGSAAGRADGVVCRPSAFTVTD